MRYSLNFLSTTADRQRKIHYQRVTSLLYGLIWLVTTVIFLNIYGSLSYITGVFQRQYRSVGEQINNIEPRVMFLENRVAARSRSVKNLPLYLQEKQRPLVWYTRLSEIANTLPSDLVISRISYDSERAAKAKDTPEIIIDGYMVIKDKEQDIFAVDDYRATLAEAATTRDAYSRLLVKNNRIYKDADNMRLTYTLGYYP